MGKCMSHPCMAPFRPDPDRMVLWYPGNSPESFRWQNEEDGFGYKRAFSYREAAMLNPGFNRIGNVNGELAGKILFYEHADAQTDYSLEPEMPTFRLHAGEKLFAKAFFNVPLGRIPIGENNINNSDQFRGEGGVLLASRPRAIALFLDVDGQQQDEEHFCMNSKACFNTEMKSMESLDPKPKTLDKAIDGSFFTFMCSKAQEPYCFLHLPLIGFLSDTSFKSGVYGEALIRAFCDLLATLSPGKHQIDLKIRYYYDHCDFNCLILGDGTNALGRWYKCVPNSVFKSPHETPEVLVTSDQAVACGSFFVDLGDKFDDDAILDQLDRNAPAERYRGRNAGILRNIAKTVAGGRCCEEFGLRGLPDWIVLTSDLEARTMTNPDDEHGRHTYEAMDFAALWYEEADGRKPEELGCIIEGTMGRVKVPPTQKQEDWAWLPRMRDDQEIPPRKRSIKNKYITQASKGRRISVVTSEGKMGLSDWAQLHEGYDNLMPEVNN